MRLIEFLQQHTAVPETTVNRRRIPLWYLGGSYEDYASFRTNRVFESVMLNEAAIDKYSPAIAVFQKIDEFYSGTRHVYHDTAMKELQWAMQVMQREDRIVWYMRFVKLHLLNQAAAQTPPPETENPQAVIDFIGKQRSKHLGKMRKAYGDDHTAANYAKEVMTPNTKEFLGHAFSMNVPKINATVFGSQSPDDIFWEFREMEREWLAKAEADKQVVDHSKDIDQDKIEKIIEFDDGSAWFNLNRESCSVEGDAMGHCGNRDGGSNLENETVLSFRQPAADPRGGEKHNGTGVHWRPRLTFILDKKSGMLGEMKGRANTKPVEELHPYIIKLLMNPMIKGIIGGGYAAHENFDLDDLGEDKKAAILQKKPELGSFTDMLEISGGEVTPMIVRRLVAEFDQHGVEYNEVNGDTIVVEHFADLEVFMRYYGSEVRIAKSSLEYLNGDRHFDFEDHSGHDEKVDLAIDAFDKAPKMWKQTQAYMEHTYPDEFDEDGEHDIDNVGEVCTVAMEQGEEWYDQIGWAIAEGRRLGAEGQMSDAFHSWMKEGVYENSAYSLVPQGNSFWDSELQLTVPVKTIISELYNEEYEVDDLAHGGWETSYQSMQDMDEPYYGWDGYDEEGAIEHFIGNADIPKLDHHEVPDGGNATAAHQKAFVADVKELADSDVVGNMIEKYKTVVTAFELINGAIVGDVFTWGKEFNTPEAAQDAFASTLKDLAVIASEHDVPFVVRNMNDDHMSDQVAALGYKTQDNGYLRFDPKGSE